MDSKDFLELDYFERLTELNRLIAKRSLSITSLTTTERECYFVAHNWYKSN